MATNPMARARGFHLVPGELPLAQGTSGCSRWQDHSIDKPHQPPAKPQSSPGHAATRSSKAARQPGSSGKGRWSTRLSPLAVGQRHKLPTTNSPEMSFGLVWGTRDRLPGGAALPHAGAMGRRDPVSGPSRLWPQRRHGRAACSLPSTHRGYERGACWSRPAPGGRRQGVRNSSPLRDSNGIAKRSGLQRSPRLT